MRAWLVVVVSIVAGCGFKGNEASDGGIGDDDANPAVLTVGFAADASTTDESSATYSIPVLLSAPTDHPVTVDYEVLSGGSATQPTDYTLADGQLAIATGTTQANIVVAITGAPHDDVSFTIALSAPQGASLGTHPQHTVTISTHALPTVAFNPATKSLSESNTSPSPQIALSAAASTPVTITYRVVSPPSSAVAATPGADFTLADGTVTISAGELSAALPLVVVNDTTDEFDEELDVSIVSVLNAKPDTANQLLAYTILDDDPPPTVSFATPTLALPEAAGPTTIAVALSAASGKPITVPYTVTLGTASTADIAIANGTLTFAPGTTTATIPVNVIQDAIDEDDETFSVALDIAGATNVTAGANVALAATITDDDAAPTVAIVTADGMISENGAAAVLTVQVTGMTAKTITVAFANSGGAVRGTDFVYVPSNQSLTFAPGTLQGTITVSAIDNSLDDGNRLVTTTLVNPVNATVAGTPNNTTIVDDDPTCYGTGSTKVCSALPPTGTVALTGMIDTDDPTTCSAGQPVGWAAQGQQAVCFITGSTVTISGAVTVTGLRPLIVVAADVLTVASGAVLDLGAHQSSGAAGGGAQMTCPAGTPMGAAAAGGGGAGGSFGSLGGAGGSGDGTNQSGGTAGAGGTETLFLGGCPGTSGAAAVAGQNPGTAGQGGGAVYLVAGNKLVLDGSTIDASGSGASNGGHRTGGSGGGSGGQIRLFATAITATGAKLYAGGGGGSSGGDATTNGVAGADPVSPGMLPAQGGKQAVSGKGGNGGNGQANATQATGGANGQSNGGGGGGGGGGGMVISNHALTGATAYGGLLDISP